ncbi:hypothetical protein Leryth_001182, partial [Lithospermum erythrorhizon]
IDWRENKHLEDKRCWRNQHHPGSCPCCNFQFALRVIMIWPLKLPNGGVKHNHKGRGTKDDVPLNIAASSYPERRLKLGTVICPDIGGDNRR